MKWVEEAASAGDRISVARRRDRARASGKRRLIAAEILHHDHRRRRGAPWYNQDKIEADAVARLDLDLFDTGNATSILATGQFAALQKIEMVHIPYKGDGPLSLDLVAGRVNVSIATPGLAAQHVKDGRLRALATLLPNRSPLLPDAPTMQEAVIGRDFFGAHTYQRVDRPDAAFVHTDWQALTEQPLSVGT